MDKKEKKEGNDFTKGLLTGIGAAIGIAALGIGGKLLYDKYKEKETPEEEDERDESDNENNGNQNNINKTSTMETNDENEIEGKESFICPINQTIMTDPVITPYGTTYERSAILNWLKKNKTDPLTKKKLTADMLITNFALRDAIQEYKDSLEKNK